MQFRTGADCSVPDHLDRPCGSARSLSLRQSQLGLGMHAEAREDLQTAKKIAMAARDAKTYELAERLLAGIRVS